MGQNSGAPTKFWSCPIELTLYFSMYKGLLEKLSRSGSIRICWVFPVIFFLLRIRFQHLQSRVSSHRSVWRRAPIRNTTIFSIDASWHAPLFQQFESFMWNSSSLFLQGPFSAVAPSWNYGVLGSGGGDGDCLGCRCGCTGELNGGYGKCFMELVNEGCNSCFAVELAWGK